MTIEAKRSRCGRHHLAHRHQRTLHREDLLQLRVVCVDEDLVLEQVDPVVDRLEAGEEAVDEAVDDGVQQPGGVVDRCVALDVSLAKLRDRGRVVAMQRDEIVIGVEAVHLDETVGVVVVGGTEDDEEDVAVVVVDLRPLVELPRVLEREWMEAELLPQDLEIGRLRIVHVEPEELTCRRAAPAPCHVRDGDCARRCSGRGCPGRATSELTRRWYDPAPEGHQAPAGWTVAGRSSDARRTTVTCRRGLRHRRHEVRRLVGRRPGQDQARRATARRREAARSAGRRHGLGDGQDDRRADRPRPRGLADAERARVRHAPLDGRADRLRARRDGDPRSRAGGRLADGLAGRHPHGRGARQGQDPRDPRRQGPGRSRSGQDRARRRVPGLLARHDGDHDPRPRRHRRDGGRPRGGARCGV